MQGKLCDGQGLLAAFNLGDVKNLVDQIQQMISGGIDLGLSLIHI